MQLFAAAAGGTEQYTVHLDLGSKLNLVQISLDAHVATL